MLIGLAVGDENELVIAQLRADQVLQCVFVPHGSTSQFGRDMGCFNSRMRRAQGAQVLPHVFGDLAEPFLIHHADRHYVGILSAQPLVASGTGQKSCNRFKRIGYAGG